jgi:hypothetical protein
MVDRMIVLMVPLELLPSLFPEKKNEKPKDILMASVMEFFYWMVGIAIVNLVLSTWK